MPSVRTIARILERRGALDGQRRVRRPPPPPGWYLPDVAARQAELDSFDVVEGHHLQGGIEVEVLTGVSLHGGLVAAWPGPPVRARTTLDRLVEHWRQVGRPAYAQFDNDTRFHGSHGYPDLLGPVGPPVPRALDRAGLRAAPRARLPGGHRRVAPTAELVVASADYVQAHRARSASRIEAAPIARTCR